jgi:phosphoribosylanthranilate isomerase
MSLKIKICGMRDPDNITGISGLMPDMMGFIFYRHSKRYAGKSLDLSLLKELPHQIKKTGVFVNEPIDKIINTVSVYCLDFVQLHGNETPELCRALKKKGIGVIKSFSISKNYDFEQCSVYVQCTDFFLFDTYTFGFGGSGVKFDWDELKNYKVGHPFFLSGGISPDDLNNISSISANGFYGIDLNSRFENKPGIKNYDTLKSFISALRNNDNHLMNKTFISDSKGYYGQYGGAFIPEMLRNNIESLKAVYYGIIESEEFKNEFNMLLADYAGRPSPLYFARRLSKKYGAKIYLKREDLNHTGSHKINNTIGQILLAEKMGKTRIIAETGAGQHGVATATVCALMGLECVVYMGETDMVRQEPNVKKMEMLGATVIPATCGNKTLKDATNEALRDWISNPEDTFYIIGSVVGPHPYPDLVAKFQSVISEELMEQLSVREGTEDPDYIIACVGGGSNAAGIFYNYIDRKKVKLIGVEAAGKGVGTNETAATIAVGEPGIIHGSKTLLLQNEDGQITEPYSISAGLDYPGVGPLHAHLAETGRATYMNATDKEALAAAYELTRLEGIIPALESAHALAVLGKLNLKPDDVLVVNISGRGDKDMEAYIEASQNYKSILKENNEPDQQTFQ